MFLDIDGETWDKLLGLTDLGEMFDNFNYLWHDDDSLDNFLLELRDSSDDFVIDGDADGWSGSGNFDGLLLY